MVRIFLSLSIFAISATLLTMVVGLSLGDLKSQLTDLREVKSEFVTAQRKIQSGEQADETKLVAERDTLQTRMDDLARVQSLATIHRLVGVATALLIVFVNCLSVTYFIGTARWIKEVCDTYPIEQQSTSASRRIKSRSFPWAVLGVLTAMGISMLGAASDPSSGNLQTEQWVDWHLASALAGIAILAYAFYRQWLTICANQQLIEKVVADVAEVREQRELPVG